MNNYVIRRILFFDFFQNTLKSLATLGFVHDLRIK